MFHGETIKTLKNLKIHEILFYVFLFLIPIQTRILYQPETAYISWYFNYHLAFFFYLTDILLIACFVSWIMFHKPKELFQKRLFWLILAFLCLILVTLFHPPAVASEAWRAGVKRLNLDWYQALKWAELLILVLYIRETIKSKTQYLWTFIILFIGSTIQAIIGLVQFHVQHSLGLGFLGEYIAPLGTSGLATIETSTGKIIRAYGTFSHPNILGTFLVLGLILGLFLVSRGTLVDIAHPRDLSAEASTQAESGDPRNGPRIKSGVVKILIMLGLILIILGLFVTFSRIAWISALIAIIIFVLFHACPTKLQRSRMKHRDWSKIIVICAILIVSCLSVVVLTKTDGTIFGLYRQTLKARVIDSNSTAITDRVFFDRLGLDLTFHYPGLGVGVGNYVEALKDLYKLEPWQNQPAHNIFIFVSAELGILGLILFILILLEIFSSFKNVSWDTLSVTLACLGIIFLFMSQMDHYFVTIQQGRLMFFTVLGLIAALPNLKKENNSIAKRLGVETLD